MQGKNNRCLECNPDTKELFVNKCDINNENMLWKFGMHNQTFLDTFDKNEPVSNR